MDASTPWMNAGILRNGRWLALERAEGDALTLLPELVKSVLAKCGMTLDAVTTLIHCEGPGALLGLRLASMMIEAWRASLPVKPELLAYRSLDMAAAILDLDKPAEPYLVATSFRKGIYIVHPSSGQDEELVDEATFNAMPHPRHLIVQRHIKSNAPGAIPLAYDLTRLPDAIAARPGLLHAAPAATAYAPQYAEYKLWDGQRHKAPDQPPSGR
jgi:tRNA threonylcarbamoyladenosine biosynthesis protein TsaB